MFLHYYIFIVEQRQRKYKPLADCRGIKASNRQGVKAKKLGISLSQEKILALKIYT
jgi:hypothetical protein